MEWSQDFESGLPEIDGQHRQIFTLIQRVHLGVDRPGIRDVLVELEQSTRQHFDHEERIMVECNYPALTRHAAEHATLLREVERYRDNAVFGARQLNQVLCNWLMSHNIMEDRPLAQHVLQLRASRRDKAMGMEFVGGAEPSPQSTIRSKTDGAAKLVSGQ